MPYGLCPQCGASFHINVGDVQKWYERYYPELPLGSMVPALCVYCFQELKEGDRVVVRNPLRRWSERLKGSKGAVAKVLRSSDGVIFLVKPDEGEESYFARAELRPLFEKESRAEKYGWNDEIPDEERAR